MKRLLESYPQTVHYHNIENLTDLSTIDMNLINGVQKKGITLSLSILSENILGFPLDKRMQKSDWERRPLLYDQILYAALDAYVLLLLYEKLHLKNVIF